MDEIYKKFNMKISYGFPLCPVKFGRPAFVEAGTALVDEPPQSLPPPDVSLVAAEASPQPPEPVSLTVVAPSPQPPPAALSVAEVPVEAPPQLSVVQSVEALAPLTPGQLLAM